MRYTTTILLLGLVLFGCGRPYIDGSQLSAEQEGVIIDGWFSSESLDTEQGERGWVISYYDADGDMHLAKFDVPGDTCGNHSVIRRLPNRNEHFQVIRTAECSFVFKTLVETPDTSETLPTPVNRRSQE